MKKTVLFLSGLALLASCSESEEPVVSTPEVSVLEPLTSEAIYGEKVKLTMGSSVKVTQTKGTGTVGSTDAANNKWQYENLYVLMTTTGQDVDGDVLPEMLDDALSPDEPMIAAEKSNSWGYVNVKGLGQQFNGSFFSRPKTEAAVSELTHFNFDGSAEDTQSKYYPPKAVCQFYGYYLDDAAKNLDDNGNPAIAYNADKSAVEAAFQIDGSQDLMIGMATNYYDAVRYPFFCAATSRKGINPIISMKHITSRMTFEIIPGTNDDAASAERLFYIESLGVKSVNEGVLAVAKKSSQAPSVTWDDTKTAILMLKDVATGTPSLDGGKPKMENFTHVQVVFNTASPISLPGALFLRPQQTYELTLNVKENIGTAANPNWQDRTYTNTLALNESPEFEAGKSYHVKVTVYRNQAIKISASLEAWDEVTDTGLDNVGVDPDLDI